MELINSTDVQIPYLRRAILSRDGSATRLFGWRRWKDNDKTFSPNHCRYSSTTTTVPLVRGLEHVLLPRRAPVFA